MTDALSILILLAVGAVIFLITALLAPLISALVPISRFWDGFCQKLCDLRSIFSFVFGLAVAFFVCMCWEPLLGLARSENPEQALLFCTLLAAFIIAFCYACAAVCCRSGFQISDKIWISWITIILVLASLAVLYAVLAAAGVELNSEVIEPFCGQLLLCVTIIGSLIILLRAIGCQNCDGDRPGAERCRFWKRIIGVVLLVVLLGTYWIISQCRDCTRSEFELAMVGIWWDGKYDGDDGAHLRWAFDEPLSFPDGGFDLFRRESSGGSWTKLNSGGPIYPSTTWSGTADPTRWQDRGVDRVPPDVHNLYQGSNSRNFDYLRKVLSYPDLYATLFFVEGEDEPYTNAILAQQAADAANEPAVQWQFTPMALLQTMALHSEVARLLGLLYIDRTADPNVEYDYKVVGYWADRERDYEVSKISRPNTQALASPILQRADALPDVTKPIPTGGIWPTEARVALGWKPPTDDPHESLKLVEGIGSVLYKMEKRNSEGVDDGSAALVLEPYTPVTKTPGIHNYPGYHGNSVPHNPIAVTPKDLGNGKLVWPKYFGYDVWVEYGTYDYRLIGLDVFGRESAPSSPQRAVVADTTPPPPPVNVEAKIFQRSDRAVQKLRDTEFEKLFPPGSDNEYAIKVSWMWTDAQKRRHPDLKAFRIFYQISDFEAFSEPSNRDQWTVLSSYEGQLGNDKAASDSEPSIPDRFKDPNSPTGFVFPDPQFSSDPPATYYEEVFTDLDPNLISAITAGDVPAVKYGFVSVGSVDHDPFNNLGSGATPVTVYSVDLTAPDPPPAPILYQPPGAIDRAGNVSLTMRVESAVDIYRYVFDRVSRADLIDLVDLGTLPSGCPASVDAQYAALQSKAISNPQLLKQVNAISTIPNNQGSSGVADLVDNLDATVGSTQIYVAYAIDPAGNKSDPSCPSNPVEVSDRMAPRVPVVTKILGGDGEISLTWSDSGESDLDRYLVYRTADKARLTSKRRMELVLDANSSGLSMDSSLNAADASEDTVGGDVLLTWRDQNIIPGQTYHYRIVAQDVSGNVSKPSIPSAARAVDLSPPDPPVWESSNAIIWAPDDKGVDRITLDWQDMPNDPRLKYLIRRRVVGKIQWIPVSGWIENSSMFMDLKSRTGQEYEYQVRAMDMAGNKSVWSAGQTSP